MEGVSKKLNVKGKAVLIIGDTHIPYEHPDYLKFCLAVNKKYKCTTHLHAGDETDGHAISFHPNDPSLLSPGKELDLAIERLVDWYNAFPNLVLLESNHGSLIYRRMKVHGIPATYIRPLKDVYGTPAWTWYHDILLTTNYGSIYGCHGKKSTYGGLAKEQGCSAFQGHYHGKLEVTWHSRVEHSRFNMFVGCGVNWKSLAFAYGKNNIPKPILGCGVIDKEGIPHVVKMKLNGRGRWTGKL